MTCLTTGLVPLNCSLDSISPGYKKVSTDCTTQYFCKYTPENQPNTQSITPIVVTEPCCQLLNSFQAHSPFELPFQTHVEHHHTSLTILSHLIVGASLSYQSFPGPDIPMFNSRCLEGILNFIEIHYTNQNLPLYPLTTFYSSSNDELWLIY